MSKQNDFKFDKRASSYDGFEGKVSGRFYRLLLAQVKVPPDAVVLDVGCGTGTILRRMADKYNICGYGIDVEENMISEAKKKCPDMDIQMSSCEHTPFESNQFDVIIACMAYHHFADKQNFAKEASRILKTNGILYICDPCFPCVVRKIINHILKLFRVVGFFGTPQEIFENFREYSFQLEGVERDGYAQVIKLKRVG